jgi:hypothetical protein
MINYNNDPYWDDFNPDKNFHRVLFKPGVAVQARELTQAQTILQNQISQFASATYTQNTPVSGGKVTTNLKANFVKLNITYSNSSVDVTKYLNATITNVSTSSDGLSSPGSIVAQVVAVAPATGTTTTPGDPPTLIVTYLSGNHFEDGMTLGQVLGTVSTPFASTIGTAGGTTSIGTASVASISAGVFYVVNGYNQIQNKNGETTKYSIGNFVNVLPQTAILDKYDGSPSLRVGLNITEKTVTYQDDQTLLDPATSSNYQAPGADRYQITLTLETRPLQLGNDDGFIELLKIGAGEVQKQTDNSVYSIVDDYFAKRTYDTNGDFVVTDFGVTPVANTSSSAQYDLKIGRGSAFVRGYRIENQGDLLLTNDRSRDTASQNTNPVYVDYGSYFYVDTVKGVFDVSSGAPVDLHLVPASNIVSTNNTTYNSTLVGKGYVRGLVYDHNTTDANTASYVYKAYVTDITANVLSSNAAATGTANTIQFYDTNGTFSNIANAYLGVTLTIDSGTSTGDSRIITNYNGATKTATVNPAFSVIPTVSSRFSLRFDVKDVEVLANTTVGTTTVVTTANINPEGKDNGLGTGKTLLENPNAPELVYNIGYPYVSHLDKGIYSSTKVFRNKSFSGSGTVSLSITLPTAIQNSVDISGGTGTLSADAIKQNFTVIVTSTSDTANNGTVGSVMDFCSVGNTVSISPDKNTVTFSSTKYTSPLAVTVIAKVNVVDADSSTILRTKTLVTGNTATVSYSGPDGVIASNTYVDLTAGQVYIRKAALAGVGQSQSLYVTDVKKIKKIIDTGASGTSPTTGMLTSTSNDITSHYSFNNGQKDTHYGHAYLTLNPGVPVPSGNILVIFDYYQHGGGDGYFSYMSYLNESYAEIPSFTSKHGKGFHLRDCLDFRPSRKNGTATFAYETLAPSDVDTGVMIPQDLSTWYSNYSYYLARKDKLVLSKDKSFQVVQGVPSVNPIFPTEPDGSLVIANLTHEPYTAYMPSEAPVGTLPSISTEKVQHRRWTMKDISDLQTRVNNIEYYTSLNVLEQNAANLQVLDNNNLNRFKNGILVDDFSSYGTADTANPDFNVSIDRVTKQMTASQVVTNYPLQSSVIYETLGNPSTEPAQLGYQITNVGKNSNYFTLPYTTTPIITQQLASNTVNLNPFTTPVYQGVCYLNPPMDNWVDNTQSPDLLLVDPNLQVYQQSNTLNTLNVTNWQTIPGTQYTPPPNTTYTIGHGINPSPYGYVGYSTTTAQTFASQSSQTTLGYWSNLGSSYNQSGNGFITDVSIQPYVRAQQLIFRAKGMKVNTPVQTWFDGTSVDRYITNPDIVELTGVTGTFKEDDVIGYMDLDKNTFLPIASVVSTYVYPGNTGKVRLYITSNFHTSHKISVVGELSTNIVKNATFDSNGTYVASTAQGIAANSRVITFNNQGFISSAGGAFTDAAGQSKTAYRRVVSGYGEFLNAYGVWTTADGSGNADISYTVYFPKTQVYYFQCAADEYATVYLDGTAIFTTGGENNEGISTVYSASIAAGNHTVRVVATAGSPSDDMLALAIATGPWTPSGTWNQYGLAHAGDLIFDTAHPPGVLPAGVLQVTGMVGGGGFYTGTTQLALNPSASNVTNYYVGTTINIQSTYVSPTVAGSPVNQSIINYTATITAYDGPSRIATLSRQVNLSLGYNIFVGGIITSTYSLSGTHYNYKSAIAQGGVATLSTNENGDFVGIFNIPQGVFKTGERVFRVDNRTTPEDSGSATTYSEATFTASGLSTTSQRLDFAPSISAAKNTFIRTQYRDNILINTSTTTNPWDPVAQTFIIDKANYPNGAFINSAKFFFESKPTNSSAPVTLSIVNTLNGYPNGDTLDNSIVTLTPDQVQVSTTPHYLDDTTYTEFKFSAPVYIQPGVLYAFILHSASTDYNVYTAAQNATALASSVKNQPTDTTPTAITKIGTAPYVGALFESQNSITWTADQTKSLMFVVNRCVFNTAANPKIAFTIPKGLQTRKLTTQDIQNYYSPNLVSRLNGSTSTVDVPSHAYNISTTDFVPSGGSLNYTFEPMLASGVFDAEQAVKPGKFGSPTYQNIYLDDGKGARMLSANSDATFSLYASLTSTDNAISPIIADDGLALYNVQYRINNLGLSNNVITLTNGGAGYNAQTTSVTVSAPSIGSDTATAVANVANGIVQSITITYPGSGYLTTPTFSIADANSTPGTGATATAVSEFSPSGGNAAARYVTKKVTLTAGNDSQDLRVFFTAYRPQNTNIYVFYRIQNRNDSQVFENGGWQLMTYVNNTGGFSKSRGDMLEFEAAPGINGYANNQVTYTSTNGTTYNSFNQFAIKIVLTATDGTTIPNLTDIRALALPSGTGI